MASVSVSHDARIRKCADAHLCRNLHAACLPLRCVHACLHTQTHHRSYDRGGSLHPNPPHDTVPLLALTRPLYCCLVFGPCRRHTDTEVILRICFSAPAYSSFSICHTKTVKSLFNFLSMPLLCSLGAQPITRTRR